MSKCIYMDNAATTQVYPEVFDAMKPYFTEFYGNPSSIYSFAGNSKKAVEDARKTIADFLGARTEEIYFTGGGSESDNWALKATADAYANKGKHIITSKIEHHAILHTCEYLEKKGFEVTYLDVDENGFVNPADVEKAIRPDTILVSIMTANNEIGTIEPIAEIGKIAKDHGVLFHTDAVQAFGHIPMNVDEMNIDMLSASGHKINGPKGIGIMYIRKGVKIGSFVHGGAHIQRQIQRPHEQRANRVLVLLGGFHRQHIRHVHIIRKRKIVFHAERLAQFARRLPIGFRKLHIHMNAARILAMVHIIDEDVHMPARQPRRHTRAHNVVQKRDGPRKAEGNIQKTMIDALDLDRHFAPVLADKPAAVAGHALHGKSPLLFTQIYS